MYVNVTKTSKVYINKVQAGNFIYVTEKKIKFVN